MWGGVISVQTEAYVKGPQHQDRQPVLVVPTQPYDMELGTELGIARRMQWWYPGNPLQCKVVNRTNTPTAIQESLVVAKVYATTWSDTERILLLLERPVEGTPGVKIGQVSTEGQTGQPRNDQRDGVPDDLAGTGFDLAEASMGQLSQMRKSDLHELLRVFGDRVLFPANPNIVPACREAKVRLRLTKEDSTLHAARQRR